MKQVYRSELRMVNKRKLIFISYCRSLDAALANLIQIELTARGYRTFLDNKILPAGKFESFIANILEVSDSIIVVLSDQSAERNSQYQKMEIDYALKHAKHIVPVVTPGFNWNKAIIKAPWIASIQTFNAVVVSYDYLEAFLDRLERFVSYSGKTSIVPLQKKWWEFWKSKYKMIDISSKQLR